MEGLIEGSFVHYVLDKGPSVGQHRPAIVVKVWSKEQGSVNLQVFMDGTNDDYDEERSNDSPNLVWITSVTYSEEPNLRTWHWIEEA